MKTTYVNQLSWRDCPFQYHGTNLANMRRAELWRIASRDDINIGNAGASKNDLLYGLITFFKAMQSEQEISDLIDG